MKKIFLLSLSVLLFSGSLWAQTRTITGKVISTEDNLPIPFANIMAKGTSVGTATDINGVYSISVPENATHLEFSFLGFKSVIKEIGGNRVIDVLMSSDAMNLDEVVVVGYGTQKKSHLTGSVSKLSQDAIKDVPVSRIDQALVGKIAGVSISNSTSEAGVAPQIRIRGMGSISASNDPLVVIDGTPVADGLSFLESADVESIDILKDAASTAIYGSRGANGVILVTTRSGEVAKPKYTFSTTQGFRRPYRLNNKITTTEYTQMLYDEYSKQINDADYMAYMASISKNPVINETDKARLSLEQLTGYATDWEEEAMRNLAYNSSYQLGVSGGSKEVRYYLSGNVTNDKGIMKHSEYDRYSLRAKVDADLNKHVKVGVNLNPSYSYRERPEVNLTDFSRFPSWMPVRHTAATSALTGKPIGSYTQPQDFSYLNYSGSMPDGEAWNSTLANIQPFASSNQNPVGIVDRSYRKQHDYRLQASTFISVDFLKHFNIRASQGAYVNYNEYNNFVGTGVKKAGEANKAVYRNGLRLDLLSENILNYNQTFNKAHNVSALVGFTYQNISNRTAQTSGTNLPTENITTLNQATVILPAETFTYIAPDRILISYLARANYSYRDKYLVSASIRTDGSSRFGPENRWGWFPSVSAGWRISEEKFLASQRDWLDQLKLRFSWGVTGNDDIPALAYDNIISSNNYPLGIGGSIAPGMSPVEDALGNPAISWEQTYEYNTGFDLSIYGGRVGLTADYYYSITDRLLFTQSSLSFTGHNTYWNNVGKVRNKGYEIEINTVNIDNKNFKWRSSVNFSQNFNRLLALGGEMRQLNYGERNEIYANFLGQSAIQFYGYKTDGVWLSQAEIDAAKAGGLTSNLSNVFVPGGLKLVDFNEDGTIDEADRTVIGNPFPKFTWGFTNSFNIYNFDVSFLIQGVHGVDIINGDGNYNENLRYLKAWNQNRWVSNNNIGDGKTPWDNSGFNRMLTDYVVENGSYIALRNISIGYKLPSSACKKLLLRNVRFFASAENPLYFWNFARRDGTRSYRGINPEARSTSSQYENPLVDGYQRGTFPLQSSFSLGLDITF